MSIFFLNWAFEIRFCINYTISDGAELTVCLFYFITGLQELCNFQNGKLRRKKKIAVGVKIPGGTLCF